MNLVINNSCNLRCKYCFNEDVKTQDFYEITLEEVDEIINFASQEENPQIIKIIGGEPLMHSKFREIYATIDDYNKHNNYSTFLFTNGVLTEEYSDVDFSNAAVLLNYNKVNNFYIEKIMRGIEVFLDKQVGLALGCNLYPECSNYDWWFLPLKKFTGKIKKIRVSTAVPCNYPKYKGNPEQYFLDMKSIYLAFIKECSKYGCKVSNDCGVIPECFFSPEEMQILEQVGMSEGSLIHDPRMMGLDVDGKFNAWPCFARKNEMINIKEYGFNGLEQVADFFIDTVKPVPNLLGCSSSCVKKNDCLPFCPWFVS